MPASLQVSSDSEAKVMALFYTFRAIISVIVLMNIAIVILGGSIIPLWILLYSFQLIVYAVLLEMPQAPNTAYFMRLLLDIDTLRLHLVPNLFNIDTDQIPYYSQLIESDSFYRSLHIQILGYRPWLAYNLMPYASLFFAMTFVLLFLFLVYQSVDPEGSMRRGYD